MADPSTVFDSPTYHHLNAARLEHLRGLGLPLEPMRRVLELGAGVGDLSPYFAERAQRMVIVEGRAENVAVLDRRYTHASAPNVRVVRMDLNAPGDLQEVPFDLVFCYGLLYHLRNPLGFLDWAASLCRGQLVLETRVSSGLGPGLHFVPEDPDIADRAMDGVGVRIDRDWLLGELARRFPHVYIPKRPPEHPDFPADWSTVCMDAGEIRQHTATQRIIAVCSVTPVDSPELLRFDPDGHHDSRHLHLMQIGAYHGEGVRPQDERVLLVEPDLRAFNRLRESFGDRPGVFLENVAVAAATGTRTFHSLEDASGLPEWCGRIGSLLPGHIPALGRHNALDREFALRLRGERVLCMNPRELLDAYGVERVDKLVVDAEGLDFEILEALPLERFDIPEIVFERKHMDGTLRTGLCYRTLLNRLADFGYAVTRLDKENDLAQRREPFEALSRRIARTRRWLAAPPYWLAQPTGHQRDGVVYVALGRQFFEEACRSLVTLRAADPQMPVTVFTDQDAPRGFPAYVVPVEPDVSPFKLKVRCMAASPYRNTLFLDTDTWVLGSIRPLFSLLELGFDLCVAPRPDFRVEGGKLELLDHAHREDANTGVLAYGGSPAVRALLDAWLESMAGQEDDAIRPGDHCDQWYFNARVKPGPDYARLRVWDLDPKVWNLRTFALAAALEQDLLPGTRILHARAFETRHFHGLDLTELVAERLGFAL